MEHFGLQSEQTLVTEPALSFADSPQAISLHGEAASIPVTACSIPGSISFAKRSVITGQRLAVALGCCGRISRRRSSW